MKKDVTKDFYNLLVFLLITIALLIAASISCYLIKYKPKQKYLLSYCNNEFVNLLMLN